MSPLVIMNRYVENMKFEEIASKEEFIITVMNRLSKAYTVPVHSFGVILSIAISFYLTFVIEHDPIGNSLAALFSNNPLAINFLSAGKLELINISSFVVVFFFYKYFFHGLSFESTPFYVYYRYSPVDFLKYTYLATCFLSIVISTFSLEFTKGGNTEKLSLIESLYFIIGVISTTGSNIYPASTETEILTIILSACTLFLVIFIFSKLPEIKFNKKIYFKFSEKHLSYNYDKIITLLNESELTEKQKVMVFKYFLERFDFNQPDGTGKVFMEMEKGDFSFGLKVYQ